MLRGARPKSRRGRKEGCQQEKLPKTSKRAKKKKAAASEKAEGPIRRK
jgi:hypothetical protein